MILVTGATGLVGSHLLAKLLQTEHRVKALFRSEEKKAATQKVFSYYFAENTTAVFNRIEWIQADITNIPQLTEAFQGISQVYHCAGLIRQDPKDHKILRKVNVEGTANIVNLCLAFEVEKLCYVSSIAALGKELNNAPITENSILEHDGKHSVYALTKYGGEMEVWRGSQEGLNVIIVNPGIIIGAGNWDSGSGLLFKKINRGFSYFFPKVTGFISVEDVVKIMIVLMQKPVKNERYTLVSENISFKEVLSEISKSLNKPIPKNKLKPWMVYCAWLAQWLGSNLFGTKRQITKQDIQGLFKKSIYDTSKIKDETGIEFSPMKEVIQKNAQIFMKENHSV